MEEIVGCSFTQSFSHPFIDPYKLKGWYRRKENEIKFISH
jgi:hypothetical protein